MTFASCSNSSDSDDENPSPSLPENVGENPIKETVRLKSSGNYKDYYLELKSDGTALKIYYNSKSDVEETDGKFKYTYDDEKKTITMKLEKESYHNEFFYSETEGQLLTYDETISKFDEEFTTEKIRQSEKEWYEERKNDKWFKEYYPDCDTYEKYEEMFVKREGFNSLSDFVNSYKQSLKDSYKAYFGVQITYAYKIEGSKMTLTEKFTGVKNLIGNSECKLNDNTSYGYTDFSWANIEIREDDSRYSRYDGEVNTDKKIISFESEENGEKIEATYTENISEGTVTINFKGKEYVCKFEGEKYIQE